MKKITLLSSALAAVLAISACQQTSDKSQTVSENGIEAEDEESQVAEKKDYAPAPAGSIVYFDLDRVLDEYDFASELRKELETKVDGISNEVNRRQNKLEKDAAEFQEKIKKGLLVQSVAQDQQEKLLKQEEDFRKFAAQKQQEIAEEQQVTLNNIADAVKQFVDKYNEEKGYAMILSTQGSLMPAPVVTADPSLDITDDIIAGLNKAYAAKKESK